MRIGSQHNEEEIIQKYLGHIDKGIYVDIGAGWWDRLSNTYALYQKGWRGLTIEPFGFFIQGHKDNRPEDTLLQVAITNYDGEIEMCETATKGSFIGDDYINNGTPGGTRPPVRIEKCMTMNTLVSQYPQFANPDFCSIDIETNEEKLLECCDFTKFTPTLIIIEHFVRETDYSKNWKHYLDPYYDMVEVVEAGSNLVFLRRNK